jgi:GH43 family beta-xylosidase
MRARAVRSVTLAAVVFEASPENGIYGPGRGTFAHARDGSDWLVYAAKSTDAPQRPVVGLELNGSPADPSEQGHLDLLGGWQGAPC